MGKTTTFPAVLDADTFEYGEDPALDAVQTFLGAVQGTAGTNVAITDKLGVRTVVITGTAVAVTVANSSGVSFGGVTVFTFPEGHIAIHGAVVTTGVSLSLPGTGSQAQPLAAGDGGDFAFGTTVAGNGTLTGADVDIIPSTSIDPLSGTVTSELAADIAAPYDGSSTATAVFINFIIDTGDVSDGDSETILATFVLEITYSFLGDN